jgi:hypothetical protein
MALSAAQVKHDGAAFRVYYYKIDAFEEDLAALGEFLESVKAAGEEVVAVVPNTGFVGASWVLEGFQGVKGFAVVSRKP